MVVVLTYRISIGFFVSKLEKGKAYAYDELVAVTAGRDGTIRCSPSLMTAH